MSTETYVEKMLVISTAHLTEETAQRLTKGERFGAIYYPKDEYGWVIYAESNELPAIASRLPDDLNTIMNLAVHLGCTWLMLDRDADTHPDLPTYEW